jgi:hypothetical protein
MDMKKLPLRCPEARRCYPSSVIFLDSDPLTPEIGRLQRLLGLGLSSELRRILNMSTGPDVSVAGAFWLAISLQDEDRRAGRQYLWLERYHAHLAAQQRDMQQSTASAPVHPSQGHRRTHSSSSSIV